MKALLLKLDTAVYIRWKAAADREGKNVSEWIRDQCNGMVAVDKFLGGAAASVANGESDGSTDNQNVPRVAADSVPARRTSVPERRSARRGRGRLRAIEDVTNAIIRNFERTVPSVLPTSGVAGVRHETVGSAGDFSFGVTRENFAETMALVKPDEIDYWARQLDPAVLPPHDGKAAAQNKCVCRHCLDKRKTLGIWYGYESKGKKK